MQLKEDEVVVNWQLKPALFGPLSFLRFCTRIARQAVEEDCPSDDYVKRRALEFTQICSEASALLHRFEARVERQLKKAR
jgi:hypothetical protein